MEGLKNKRHYWPKFIPQKHRELFISVFTEQAKSSIPFTAPLYEYNLQTFQ